MGGKINKNLPASVCPNCQNDRLCCTCGSIKKKEKSIIPDIPDILQKMSKACPVANKASVEFNSEFPGVIRFWWNFKVNKRQFFHHFEVPVIHIYNTANLDDALQASIMILKRKIKFLTENH